MNCNECSELLSQYLDNEVTSEEQQSIKNHLDKCPPCHEEYELLKQTVSCIGNLECVEPPDDFHHKVMDEIHKENQPAKIIWPFWGSLTLGSMAAAALLLIALIYNPFSQQGDLPKLQLVQKPIVNEESKKASNAEDQPWEDFHSKQKADQANQRHTKSAQQYPQNNNLVKTTALGSYSSSKSSKRSISPKNNLYRQNREWSGEDSRITTKQHFVINSISQAKSIWKKTGVTPLPLTNMNWKKNQLVALFVGSKPNHGHEIQLKSIESQKDSLIVYYHINSSNQTLNQGLSNPFLVFEMKKSNLPITFIEE